MNFNLKPRNLHFFFWGASLFLIFIFLGILQIPGYFTWFDLFSTKFVQTVISRSFDQVLSLFSLLGNFEPTTLILIVIGLWIYRREKRLYFPLVLFAFMMVFELIGKYFLYHPGPPEEFFRFNLPFRFPRLHVETNYSFPSGHVSRATFLAVFGLFLGNKYLHQKYSKWIFLVTCLLLVGFMAVSRIYLGEHWTSDVLGGLFLGASMGLLALVYY